MKQSTRKPVKKNSFAFVTGEMYYQYEKLKGGDCPQCQYYKDLFPKKEDDPKAYATYEAEFEAGRQHQKDLGEESEKDLHDNKK